MTACVGPGHARMVSAKLIVVRELLRFDFNSPVTSTLGRGLIDTRRLMNART